MPACWVNFTHSRTGRKPVRTPSSGSLNRTAATVFSFPSHLQFDTLFRQIWEEQRAYEIKFLEEHPGSLTSLIVVNYSFGVRPVLSMDEDLAWYRKVDSSLTARFPGNRHVIYNSKRIADFERQKQLKAGTKP